MNSTRFVIHTHLPAPSSVFREVSTGEAVCPHASHWARAAGSNSFSFSFEFRIFRTNKMSSPTAVQPPPPVKPPPTPPSVGASAGKGVSSKIYNGIIGYADKFVPAKLRPLWVHPAGVILSTWDISLLLLYLSMLYSFRTKDDFLLGTRCQMGKLFWQTWLHNSLTFANFHYLSVCHCRWYKNLNGNNTESERECRGAIKQYTCIYLALLYIVICLC